MICKHLGEKKFVVKILCGEYKLRSMSNVCAIHTRCIPKVKLENAYLEAWNKRAESEIYTICDTCKDRQEKNDEQSVEII
jgi:hypothetical protein